MVYNATNATRPKIHFVLLMAFSMRPRMPWSIVTVLNRPHQATCVSKYQRAVRTLYTVGVLFISILFSYEYN